MSDYDTKLHFQNRQQRFEAALAFTVAACDIEGLATDTDVRYAVEQADRLIAELDKTET